MINNHKEDDPKIIANKFNDFFATVGTNQSNKIPNAIKDYKSYLKNPNPSSLFLTPTFPLELHTEAKKLKSKTCSSMDSISTTLMKDTIQEISTPLCHIFN